MKRKTHLHLICKNSQKRKMTWKMGKSWGDKCVTKRLNYYNNWIPCCTYRILQQTFNIYIKTLFRIELKTLITYYFQRWSAGSCIFFLHIWDVNIDSILQDDASHASFFQVTTFLRLRKHLFNKCRQVF